MKEKFKIVCINNKPMKGVNEKTQNLTIGKVYETYDRPDYSSVVVINDIGNEVNYSSHRFITIEEWRERKLNEILNEV